MIRRGFGSLHSYITRSMPPFSSQYGHTHTHTHTHKTTAEDDDAATLHHTGILTFFHSLCWVSVEVLTAFLVGINEGFIQKTAGAGRPRHMAGTARTAPPAACRKHGRTCTAAKTVTIAEEHVTPASLPVMRAKYTTASVCSSTVGRCCAPRARQPWRCPFV